MATTQKIRNDIAKTKEKIAEQQKRLRALEAQLAEEENLEIVRMVKAVKLENVTDKQGFHATMYIKFNPEKGRPYRYDTNPDVGQQVAPSNESRTQVAVNNEGKTNEATKELKEPLQKGQTAPKNENQQRQQDKPKKNNKGMKM